MASNPVPVFGVGQIRMGRDMGRDLRFNRLGQQLPGVGTQDIRQGVFGK